MKKIFGALVLLALLTLPALADVIDGSQVNVEFLKDKKAVADLYLSEPSVEFGGIGIQWSPLNFEVDSILNGAPAERTSIKKGDRLVAIDGQPVKGLSYAEVIKKVRGAPGTEVA